MRGQVMLCILLALVECTRIFFSRAKTAPCLLAHSKHHSLTVYSILQYSYVKSPLARAFTSSMKLVAQAGSFGGLQIVTSLAL